MLRIGSHLLLVRRNIEIGVHGLRRGCRARRFEFVNVGAAKQELPRKIGLFDAIHIRNVNVTSFATAHTHQGPVLEHFATNRTGTNNEIVQLPNLFLHVFPKHRNLTGVPSRGRQLFGGQDLVRQTLVRVQVKESIERCEFS